MSTDSEIAVLPTTESQLIKVAFGKVVTNHRLKAGFKQRVFSRTCGISNSHLRSIEAGQVSPTVVTLYKIAATLGESPSRLIEEVQDVISRQQIAVDYQRPYHCSDNSGTF